MFGRRLVSQLIKVRLIAELFKFIFIRRYIAFIFKIFFKISTILFIRIDIFRMFVLLNPFLLIYIIRIFCFFKFRRNFFNTPLRPQRGRRPVVEPRRGAFVA